MRQFRFKYGLINCFKQVCDHCCIQHSFITIQLYAKFNDFSDNAKIHYSLNENHRIPSECSLEYIYIAIIVMTSTSISKQQYQRYKDSKILSSLHLKLAGSRFNQATDVYKTKQLHFIILPPNVPRNVSTFLAMFH